MGMNKALGQRLWTYGLMDLWTLLLRNKQPRLRLPRPRVPIVAAQPGGDRQACLLEPPGHLRQRNRAKRQREPPADHRARALLDEVLVKERETACRLLLDRLDERDVRLFPLTPPAQARLAAVLTPRRQVGDEFRGNPAARRQHAGDGFQRRGQVALVEQRLQDAVRRGDEAKARVWKWQRADVAADEARPVLHAKPRGALPGPREHRRGQVHADDRSARAREGDRHAPGAA